MLLGNTVAFAQVDRDETFLPAKVIEGPGVPRECRSKATFSALGLRCIDRLEGQIDKRLPEPTVDDIVAMLMDPRTKAMVRDFVTEPALAAAERQIQRELLVIAKAMRAPTTGQCDIVTYYWIMICQIF